MGNEENKTLYDIYRGILCNNQSFQLGKQAQVEYRFDCPEYAELKEKADGISEKCDALLEAERKISSQ